MAESNLLGVARGIKTSTWLGRHQRDLLVQREGEAVEDTPSPAQTAAEVRDARIVTESVADLLSQVIPHSQTVDLASLAANTVDNRTIVVTPTGRVVAGDYVLYVGGDLPLGFDIKGGGPAPANDTIPVRVENRTGAAIDPGSMTLYFLVVKRI